MTPAQTQIIEAIQSGQPLLQIVSCEEKRVEQTLSRLSEQFFKTAELTTWDPSSGLCRGSSCLQAGADPLPALEALLSQPTPGISVWRDLPLFWGQNPLLLRKIREAYNRLQRQRHLMVLLSPEEERPSLLRKEVPLVFFGLPDADELGQLFQRFVDSYRQSGRPVQLHPDQISAFVSALQGFTLDEATRALRKMVTGKTALDGSLLQGLLEEKKHLLAQETVLEFVSHTFTLGDLGGLANLKDWLGKRRKAFGPEAKAFGLSRPRGILTMGISGCGKSLTAKIVAAEWKVPLFRLDMNIVYSGMSGSPESVFSRAIQTVEAMAPAILWIDEIESGISDKQGDGASSRILGYFLTWMQEHQADVFIAATANRIDLVPAELLGRGRFDEIFFIDLPTQKEREEIFSIHLQRRKNDMSLFNVPQLAQITKGWSGSEIEQVIISGMFEAFNQNRPLNEDDLFTIFGRTVPLSTTMEEQIKKIRSWAHNRAARASADKEY